MDDLISREQAIDALNGELIISGEDNVKAVEEYIYTAIRKLNELPSIDAVPTDSISRIEKELHGRDVEMQYEIIRWLWNYGNQFTDSRTAILQWLRGEES